MTLTNKEVAEITGDTVEDIASITSTDDASITSTDHLDNVNVMKLPEPDGDVVHCDLCDASFHGTMAKAQLGRHKSAKHGIKKSTEVKEVSPVSTPKSFDHIPSDYEQLGNVLKRWGVGARADAIVEAMKYGEISDLRHLKELLIGAQVQGNLREAIVQEWAQYHGLKTDLDIRQTQPSGSLNDIYAEQERGLRIKLLEKNIGGGSTENSEVAALKVQLNALLEQLTKKETQEEINALRKEIKETQERSDSNTGMLNSAFKEFSNNLVHQMEIDRKDREIKALQDAPKTQTGEAFKELRGMVADIGAGIGKANQAVVETTEGSERATRAIGLLNRGVTPEQVAFILGPPRTARPHLDAAADYRMLEKVTAAEPKPQSPVDLLEQKSKEMFERNNPPLAPVKINVDG